MKKIILTAIAVGGLSIGAFAQGTVVFQNFVGGVAGLVYSNSATAGNLYNGALNLELFSGPVGDTAAQLLALNNGFIYSGTLTGGQFYDANTDTAGGTALGTGTGNTGAFFIAAWTGSATNYQAAVLGGGSFGASLAFDNPTGGAGSPAATAANLVNWLAGNPVVVLTPEPATLVLGGLGAAGLLLFRRRK